MECQIADKIPPVVEEHQTEPVEESAPHKPLEEPLPILARRCHRLAHPTEREVDGDEDEEDLRHVALQELQPGRNHLNDAVDEITDGLCKVVRHDPVLRMPVEVKT